VLTLAGACRALALTGPARFTVTTAARLLEVSTTDAHRLLDALSATHFVDFHLDDGTYSVERLACSQLLDQALRDQASRDQALRAAS